MLSSPRHYHFHSEWEIRATPAQIWQALLSQPFAWDHWWPQLRDVHDIRIKPGEVGSSFRCSWQAPLGYRLDCLILVKSVEQHQSAVLEISGDLAGTAVCTMRRQGDVTHLSIDWQVKTMKAWMNRLAPLLKPLFVWGHHTVMMSGERGFSNYMIARLTQT